MYGVDGSHSQDISLSKWQIVALLGGRGKAGISDKGYSTR